MSDHQKLDQLIGTMTSVLESIKADGLTVTQMIDEFSRAARAYQEFEMAVANDRMDVIEVKVDESGAFKEQSFEWKNL